MFSMYNPFWTQFIVDKPPTVYSLLESIVNYGKDEKTKIKDLAKAGRSTFFNFNYPLSNKVSKEDFETMILNNFIDRRIGYETLTTFRIKLNVKLNEIMPTYNKMFDMLDGWDIFEDGGVTNRTVSDSRNINTSNRQDIDGTITKTENIDNTTTNTEEIEGTITNNSETNATTETSSQTSTSTTTDKRKSDTPQSELVSVQNGSYVTDYEYDTNTSTGSDSSETEGNTTNESTNVEEKSISSRTVDDKNLQAENVEDKTVQNNGTTTNVGSLTERVEKTPTDKLKIYTEFIEKRQHIYSMIFKELDCLFYQLV